MRIAGMDWRRRTDLALTGVAEPPVALFCDFAAAFPSMCHQWLMHTLAWLG